MRDNDIMLEQPCRTVADCARVREATGLPMKLDEATFDTMTLLEGHAQACMDAVAIKLSKFGGISACRAARDLCLHLGAQMCIEDTWGSDITTAALLHLAATTPSVHLLNTCDLAGYVVPRLEPNAPSREIGFMAPPKGPGLGVEPDPDVLREPDLTLE